MSKGCCNATATAALAALTNRIALERGDLTSPSPSRPHSPDFLRGLQVAKVIVRESLEKA
jgi:hypothetical protein